MPGDDPGLLAGRSGGARAAAQTRGRNADAGAGMAAVRGDAGGRRQSHPADRALRSRRGRGPVLLVWAVGNPSDGVRRDAAQHRSCCDNGGRDGAVRADAVTPPRQAESPLRPRRQNVPGSARRGNARLRLDRLAVLRGGAVGGDPRDRLRTALPAAAAVHAAAAHACGAYRQPALQAAGGQQLRQTCASATLRSSLPGIAS